MTDQEIIEHYQAFEKLVRDYRASEMAYQKEHRKGPADLIKAKMKELAALIDAWSLKPKAPQGKQVGMF